MKERIRIRATLVSSIPYLIAFINILAFAYIDNFPYSPLANDDQALFQRIAKNLAMNGHFSGSLSFHKVFCPSRPPLYPLILALTWRFSGSESLLYIRIIQCVAYLLSIYFIFRITMILTSGNKLHASMGATIASLIPDLAAATHIILTECLSLFLLSLSVLLSVLLKRKIRNSYLLTLGIVLGLLSLLRPTFLLMPIPLIAYVLWHSQKSLKNVCTIVMLIILPFVFVLSPWMIVNKKNKGSYMPTYTAVGLALFEGIFDSSPSMMEQLVSSATGMVKTNFDTSLFERTIEEPSDSDEQMLPDQDFPSKEKLKIFAAALVNAADPWLMRSNPLPVAKIVAADNFLKKIAINWIKRNPGQYVRIVLKHIQQLMIGDQPVFYHSIAGPLYYVTLIIKLFVYVFFLIGLIEAVRNGRFDLLFFPLMITGYLIAVHALMHVEQRYFMCALLFMAMIAPAGVKPSLVKSAGTRLFLS
jgi:4-amino-4-deoxy-L-arabinose transferase-like glycosyltransferase